MEFKGTERYVATDELKVAVNAAITLQKPLLIKGEPGTGKTMLAFEIAEALKKRIYTWNVKSTTIAQQGLYEYDAVSRLRDSQLGDKKVKDIICKSSEAIRKATLQAAFLQYGKGLSVVGGAGRKPKQERIAMLTVAKPRGSDKRFGGGRIRTIDPAMHHMGKSEMAVYIRTSSPTP